MGLGWRRFLPSCDEDLVSGLGFPYKPLQTKKGYPLFFFLGLLLRCGEWVWVKSQGSEVEALRKTLNPKP